MADNNDLSRLYLITGSRGAGKTHLCRALAQAARSAGWQTTGLLSNPVFDGVYRVQIVAEDLHSGESHILATRKAPEAAPSGGPATTNWQFDSQVIAWGNQVLSSATPTDLLVVDELGPLEFEREQGWLAGLDALASKRYTIGLVVVRPEFLGEALMRWPDTYIVEVDTPEDSQEKGSALARMLFNQ